MFELIFAYLFYYCRNAWTWCKKQNSIYIVCHGVRETITLENYLRCLKMHLHLNEADRTSKITKQKNRDKNKPKIYKSVCQCALYLHKTNPPFHLFQWASTWVVWSMLIFRDCIKSDPTRNVVQITSILLPWSCKYARNWLSNNSLGVWSETFTNFNLNAFKQIVVSSCIL